LWFEGVRHVVVGRRYMGYGIYWVYVINVINQGMKFADDLAEHSAQIRDLLRKDRIWSWDVALQVAFDRIK
jgi:hypothetical protein